MNGQGNSGKSAVDFLRDTVEGFSNFKKLNRAQTLLNQKKLSAEEDKLLKKLLKDKSINKFLKSKK